MAVLLGLQCLPCWYLARGLPLGETPAWRLLGTWLGTDTVLLSLWLAIATGWIRILKALDLTPLADPNTLLPLLVFAGCVGLLIAISASTPPLPSNGRARPSAGRWSCGRWPARLS